MSFNIGKSATPSTSLFTAASATTATTAPAAAPAAAPAFGRAVREITRDFPGDMHFQGSAVLALQGGAKAGTGFTFGATTTAAAKPCADSSAAATAAAVNPAAPVPAVSPIPARKGGDQGDGALGAMVAEALAAFREGLAAEVALAVAAIKKRGSIEVAAAAAAAAAGPPEHAGWAEATEEAIASFRATLQAETAAAVSVLQQPRVSSAFFLPMCITTTRPLPGLGPCACLLAHPTSRPLYRTISHSRFRAHALNVFFACIEDPGDCGLGP